MYAGLFLLCRSGVHHALHCGDGHQPRCPHRRAGAGRVHHDGRDFRGEAAGLDAGRHVPRLAEDYFHRPHHAVRTVPRLHRLHPALWGEAKLRHCCSGPQKPNPGQPL